MRIQGKRKSLLFVNKKKQKNFDRLLCFAAGVIFSLSIAGTAFANDLSGSVISTTDLTGAFHTKENTSLVVTQDAPPNGLSSGLVHVCFAKDGNNVCPTINGYAAGPNLAEGAPKLSGTKPSSDVFPFTPNQFEQIKIIQPNQYLKFPLLVVSLFKNTGGPGSPLDTVVFVYRRSRDNFEVIFAQETSVNMNEEIRVLPDGPLSGDVAAVYLGASKREPWRYTYGITLYRLTASGHYIRALHFLGKAKEGDGDPRPVIDSDMPEILKLMGAPNR